MTRTTIFQPRSLLYSQRFTKTVQRFSRLAGPTLGGVLLLALSACAVGPDYQRPSLNLPDNFRGDAAENGVISNDFSRESSATFSALPDSALLDSTLPDSTLPGAEMALAAPLGQRNWTQVFTDSALQALIQDALTNNLDLGIAEARLREAQAGVTIARAGLLPTVSLGLNTTPIARLPGDDFSSSFLAAGLLSWEIDLWGRVRRATEAARADLAGRAAARDGTQVTLVAETARRHFEIGALRDVLSATQYSAQLQSKALTLMQRRNQAGIVSAAEVRQAESQLASTQARIPAVERQLFATENALALLLGKPPGAVEGAAPNSAVTTPHNPRPDLTLPAALPAGLPSALLERRPDVREAEQGLVAANARVGEAKARLFPSVSLTGVFGGISTSLNEVFSNPSTVASLGPNLTQTLYAGGALLANQDAARARLDQALLRYRQTVLNALREVSDALNGYQRYGEELEQQQLRVTAAREALRLADKRFAAGVVSYLEVLDAQRQLLASETDFVNTRLARQTALIQVYRALGGGWQGDANSAKTPVAITAPTL